MTMIENHKDEIKQKRLS